MGNIFISHSSLNTDQAKEVLRWLIENGWDDVFLDLDPDRGIAAGQRWKDALQKAAQRCEIVLALVSKEWLASGWCKAEIDAARLMGKKVIVALIGADKKDVPPDLMDEQWVDLKAGPEEYRRLAAGLQLAGLDPSTFELEPGRRPYPGFAYFDEKDAAIFFGRDGQIVRALDRMRSLARIGVERMLVILGASGSGKSSFLRAGLWPRLNRDERSWLPLPTIRPERAALSGFFGLAQALQQKMSEPRFTQEIAKRGLPRNRAAIQDFIQSNEDGLLRIFDALRDIARVPTADGETTPADGETMPAPMIILSIDQGEELFNDDGREEAERFIEMLTRTLAASPARALVLIAMRSDALPRLQAERLLAECPKDTFPLEAMLESSYASVIEGPARLIRPKPLKIDPRLTEELLKDVSGQDALPLLAFTLAHLYENYTTDNALKLADYEKIGRLKGVIDTTVKEAFADGVAKGQLPKVEYEQLDLWREAFIPHLAQVNSARQFIRRIATRDEIAPHAWPLIERFADRRLLIRDRRSDGEADVEVVEVAHEALLRQPPLSKWLEEAREFLLWRERLSQARAAFEANERGLLIGRELQRARDFVQTRGRDDFAAEDLAFINESMAEDDRRRDREQKEREAEQRRELTTRYTRLAAFVGGTLALIAFAFGMYAFQQERLKDEQKNLAEQQRQIAEGLAAQNANLLNTLRLFVSSRVPSDREAKLDDVIGTLLKGRDRYEAVGNKVNIPWYFIGILHGVETSFDFSTHLHNGDPLTVRTVHIPAGRPRTDESPFSWEDSAIDALEMQGFTKQQTWSLDEILLRGEKYNGLGYRRRGINSPYIWACTNHYTKGLYVSDGHFDANAVAPYCGVAAILKKLVDKGIIPVD